MLSIGWSELLVIALVALIVIKPKDLPKALHSFGKTFGKIQGFIRSMRYGVDEIVDEVDLEERKKISFEEAKKRELEIKNTISRH